MPCFFELSANEGVLTLYKVKYKMLKVIVFDFKGIHICFTGVQCQRRVQRIAKTPNKLIIYWAFSLVGVSAIMLYVLADVFSPYKYYCDKYY